jgi:hypothetical protein
VSTLQKPSKVSFKLKDFLSRLTSITMNGDMSRLPAMSAQLRRASVTTMQRSYCAIGHGVAGRQLKNGWKEHLIKAHEDPVIDRGFDNTSYA